MAVVGTSKSSPSHTHIHTRSSLGAGHLQKLRSALDHLIGARTTVTSIKSNLVVDILKIHSWGEKIVF